MARRKALRAIQPELTEEASLLDVVDSVLNKGAVVNGDLILGVANVDLIYAKLSVVLAALDRIMEPASKQQAAQKRSPRKRRTRG